MRSMIVVIDHPLLGLFSDLRQRTEDIAIEKLSAKAAIKAFDSGVLRRLARTDEVEHDALLFAPELQTDRDEFRAVVQPDGARLASPLANAFKRFDHPSCGKGCIDFDIEQFSIELVDNVEQAVTPAVPERIAHEVHRPDMVRSFEFLQRCLDPFGQPLLRLSADVETQLPIDAINPFVVPFISGVTDTQKQLSKPISRVLLGKVVQDVDDLLIVTFFGLIVKRTAIEVQCCTRLTDTQIVLCLEILD